MMSIQHLKIINKNDEWETPPSLLYSAMAKYKVTPKLDVCATVSNAKFQRFFTKEQNGLSQDWDVDFFMNPPYSEITSWMAKAWQEVNKHSVTGLLLTFAKTDTKWWHQYVEAKCEVHFIKGRVRFFTNGHPSQNSAPYPSAFLIMRPES